MTDSTTSRWSGDRDRPALGARENFFGGDDTDDDDDTTETATGAEHSGLPHSPAGPGTSPFFDGERYGTSYAEFVAHGILKAAGDATMLDPESLLNEPGEDVPEDWCLHDGQEVVELSDPASHVPKTQKMTGSGHEINYRQFRHRFRYAEQYGYETHGGPIADRPTAEFLEVVDTTLECALADDDIGLREDAADEIRSRAHSLKASGDLHDTQIMRRVVRWIANPHQLDD